MFLQCMNREFPNFCLLLEVSLLTQQRHTWAIFQQSDMVVHRQTIDDLSDYTGCIMRCSGTWTASWRRGWWFLGPVRMSWLCCEWCCDTYGIHQHNFRNASTHLLILNRQCISTIMKNIDRSIFLLVFSDQYFSWCITIFIDPIDYQYFYWWWKGMSGSRTKDVSC